MPIFVDLTLKTGQRLLGGAIRRGGFTQIALLAGQRVRTGVDDRLKAALMAGS